MDLEFFVVDQSCGPPCFLHDERSGTKVNVLEEKKGRKEKKKKKGRKERKKKKENNRDSFKK